VSKMIVYEENLIGFECPGCGHGHAVAVNGRKLGNGASWEWNGSMDKPTINPSINCNPDLPANRCHSFVRDGLIQFLDDSFRKLKGQTVELPEIQ